MSDEMPKGKKTIRRTGRGSVCGYVGGKFWINFGDWFDPWAQSLAQKWIENA